jgi:hypothetical protein
MMTILCAVSRKHQHHDTPHVCEGTEDIPGVTDPPLQIGQPCNAAAVKMLLRELDLARSFMDLAEAASSDPNKERRCVIASDAYDSVVRAMPEVCMNVGERSALKQTLSGLQLRLVALRAISRN